LRQGHVLLNMAGVEWTPEYLSDPRKMPYSKLPAIRVNGEIIADSDNIRLWLEARGAEFNQGLTRAEGLFSCIDPYGRRAPLFPRRL
jgi:hypothetical protein